MAVEIIKAEKEQLDAFVDFLYSVNAGMDRKDWFYVDTREEFRQLMDSGAMEIWFAMDREKIVGAFDLLIPGLADYNYGYQLMLSRDELLRVVNMDSAAVHPDYRGQGIQRKLLTAAEDWLKEKGKWILLCTIHPQNRFSLGNALKLGYRIQKELGLYGSVRYILRRDI